MLTLSYKHAKYPKVVGIYISIQYSLLRNKYIPYVLYIREVLQFKGHGPKRENLTKA